MKDKREDKEDSSIPNQYFQFLGDTNIYEIPIGDCDIVGWLKSATEEEIKESINIEEIKKGSREEEGRK